jgi:phospholipid/cholesterol/gamma-HCH transport system substrate-binding protein
MRKIVGPSIKLVIFIVITTLATYVLAATISNTNFGSTATYKALFTDASGIQEGDDVRIAGVRVGTITGIQLVRHNDSDCPGTKHLHPCRVAQISFTVEKSRQIPATVQAHIRYRNLVGQRYLEISQGGPGDANAFLKPGATIPLRQTLGALDLTALFQGFRPLIRGLGADQINELAGELIQTLQGEGGALQSLFATVSDLTNGLADKDQVIGSVIDNLSETLQILGGHDTELSNLLIQLRRFVAGLAEDRTAIGDAVVGVNNLATTTAGLLKNVRAPLAKDITDLTGLVGVLNQHQGDIQYLLTNLAPTVAGLIRTASYGSWFNFYLCDVNLYLHLPNGKEISNGTTSKDARCN